MLSKGHFFYGVISVTPRFYDSVMQPLIIKNKIKLSEIEIKLVNH